MLDQLRLLHFTAEAKLKLETSGLFVLRTCQRTLVMGFGERPNSIILDTKPLEVFNGRQAYSFLLETICGLKSKVLGEYEIVAQFKQAYAEYVALEQRETAIMQVLEKLFQDAKTVRSSHLLEIGSHTYGGLARKLLMRHCPEQKGRVLVMGSGKLAEETLKLLTRKFDVYLSARNFDRVATLHDTYGIRPVEWFSPGLYREFSLVVNTIGINKKIYCDEFFGDWHTRHDIGRRAFIDLGSPSAISTHLESNHGVYRLEDVFRFQEELDEQKRSKLANAQAAIISLVEQRAEHLKQTIRAPDLELV